MQNIFRILALLFTVSLVFAAPMPVHTPKPPPKPPVPPAPVKVTVCRADVLPVTWSTSAWNWYRDFSGKTTADFDGQDIQTWHVGKVRAWLKKADNLCYQSNSVEITGGAHEGGTNPAEPCHITVLLKRPGQAAIKQHILLDKKYCRSSGASISKQAVPAGMHTQPGQASKSGLKPRGS